MSGHGSASRYVHGKCRCEPCTDANRMRRRARLEIIRTERTEVAGRLVHPNAVHGTYSKGYVNWQCRCVPCTEANADYGRAYKACKRAATR